MVAMCMCNEWSAAIAADLHLGRSVVLCVGPPQSHHEWPLREVDSASVA